MSNKTMLYIELLKIFSGSEKFQVLERLNRKDGDCAQSIFDINTFNSGVKCKEEGDLIITSHASKAYDIGCISIRKMVTPTELTVVWSAYQVKGCFITVMVRTKIHYSKNY